MHRNQLIKSLKNKNNNKQIFMVLTSASVGYKKSNTGDVDGRSLGSASAVPNHLALPGAPPREQRATSAEELLVQPTVVGR
jgi:hypothetical protein